MKTRLFIVLMCLCAHAISSGSAPFVLCFEDQHSPPFVFGTDTPTEQGGGILLDYLFLTSEALDQPLEFRRRPWLRCQEELKAGQVDGIFAFIYSQERDTWAAFPKTKGQPDDRYVHLSRYPIFVDANSNLTWDGSQFSSPEALVQSVPGYVADAQLKALGIMPVTELQPKEGLKMVGHGRIDGYVIDEIIGTSLINELGLAKQVVPLDTPFLTQPWYVAFSKQRYASDPVAVEAFWSALRAIRVEQGQNIIEKYQLNP